MDFIVIILPAVRFPQMKSACDLQHNLSQASLKKKYFNNLI